MAKEPAEQVSQPAQVVQSSEAEQKKESGEDKVLAFLDSVDELESPEPQIKVEGEDKEGIVPKEQPSPVAEKEPSSPPVEDDPLKKALGTIESLQAQMAEMQTKLAAPVKTEEEPILELEEVLPGISLPKDTARRPIQLTDEDMIRVGWNENPTKAINNLGNAFLVYITGTLIPRIKKEIVTDLTREDTVDTARRGFYDIYTDLKGADDLVELVERRVRADGGAAVPTMKEYLEKVAIETRKRVAQIKGIPYETYVASLSKSNGPSSGKETPTQPALMSRATTGPARSSAGPGPVGLQKELDEMQ